ncbi:hypothetical protein HDC92_002606 [Pedobacter sp. AK017]|uniref:DUF4091 domain-containing protein n=1 Tax=Pedobacter sp. AK017 TaxID=2723073 RepID=UPI00160A4729|nr:DUF4091 domain-containing protein [Pedobacter sp. AK017]MBB5438922.1 hypothetical protein [Pedobacter sp. AK017]
MKSNNDRRSFLKKAAISSVGATVLPQALAAWGPPASAMSQNELMASGYADDEEVSYWLETSLNRVFPQSQPKKTAAFELLAARKSRVSFQVCFRNNTNRVKRVACSIDGPDDLKPVIRVVGLVPMPKFTPITNLKELDGVGHYPGMAPDPLLPEQKLDAAPFSSRSFWITLNIPEGMRPGKHQLKVTVDWENVWFGIEKGKKGRMELPLEINIAEMVVEPRKNFHVIHWVRHEATWNYYKTEMFDDRWWKLTRAQLADLLDHGTDVASVPVLFIIKTVFKRPCQLLIIDEPSPGKYVFDWSRVEKFLLMCKELGYKKFEWSHLWVYWGVKNPSRIYKKVNNEYVLLWPPDISGFSDTFINFLKQFLPQFHKFLLKHNVLNDSYFHLSDEPGERDIENYRKAQKVLNELAPWMHPIMDALSNIKYGREKLVDIPIPQLPGAKAYYDEKIPHWVYFCTSPKGDYLNRFFDTPLAKLRMAGFLFYHLKADGFLHWGYNYWNKVESEEILDPFKNGDGGAYPEIPFGDPFVVYPGPDGPISSIRWEVFAEALQDFAILQTAGIDKDDKRFAELRTYADYPKSEAWIQRNLADILK